MYRVTVAENDRNACQGTISGVNGEIFVLEASVAIVNRRKLPDPSGDCVVVRLTNLTPNTPIG